MIIRNAEKIDIPKLIDLLSQVLEVHAALRPDIFISGTTKYNAAKLEEMIDSKEDIICVAETEDGVVGHLFYSIKHAPSNPDFTTVLIEDLCVDKDHRKQHIGQALFEHAKEEARKNNCNAVTLAVWEGNDNAKAFYNKMNMRPKLTQMELILD